MKKLAVLFLLIGKIAFADSPLTSIDFYKAYLNVHMVKKAKASKGKMTAEIMAFLVDEHNQQTEKLAIINALGWNHKHLNSENYKEYIIKAKNYNSEFGGKYTAFLYNASAPELLYYSYMKAMENYGQPLMVFDYLERALEMEPKNLNIILIYELIKSQVLFEINEKDLAKEKIKSVIIGLSKKESVDSLNIYALRYFFKYFNFADNKNSLHH